MSNTKVVSSLGDTFKAFMPQSDLLKAFTGKVKIYAAILTTGGVDSFVPAMQVKDGFAKQSLSIGSSKVTFTVTDSSKPTAHLFSVIGVDKDGKEFTRWISYLNLFTDLTAKGQINFSQFTDRERFATECQYEAESVRYVELSFDLEKLKDNSQVKVIKIYSASEKSINVVFENVTYTSVTDIEEALLTLSATKAKKLSKLSGIAIPEVEEEEEEVA